MGNFESPEIIGFIIVISDSLVFIRPNSSSSFMFDLLYENTPFMMVPMCACVPNASEEIWSFPSA